jgi:hypothetical protein
MRLTRSVRIHVIPECFYGSYTNLRLAPRSLKHKAGFRLVTVSLWSILFWKPREYFLYSVTASLGLSK